MGTTDKMPFAGYALTPKFFDPYARIEVAIVKYCASLPSGTEEDTWRSRAFRSCCNAVTKRFLPQAWPGCSCTPSGPKNADCTGFGHRTANAIRRGIYVHYLRIWLTYHH